MPARDRELERRLQWLMTFRVVVTTTLLGCTFIIELLYRPLLPLRPLYILASAAYLLTLLYAAGLRSGRAPVAQAYAQTMGDAAIVTGFVYLTGGVLSPFSFLYLPGIVAGCILLLRRGGLLVAFGSWFLYAGLVLLMQRGIVPPARGALFVEESIPSVRTVYTLLAHLVSFLALAWLASHLTESLRRAGQELEERRGDLAQLREFNDKIIDSINSGLLTTDVEGRVTFANRAAAEITGHPTTALTGRPLPELLGQPPDFLAGIRAALGAKQRYRFEIDWRDAHARDLFLGFTVSVLKERDGTPVGMIFIFQDLTEIRVAEEEVALKKRMVALGEMAAGVAHELRNPLASISGSVQVLRRDLRPQGEAGDLMEIVVKESKRLDGIIRDFLAFAKPGRFHPEETELQGVLRETLSLLENSDERRADHRVMVDASAGPVPACVDVNRMKQVFWNLAKNALRAMPEGGTLTARARLDGHEQAEVVFADTGVGMSDAEVSENFQPFHGSFRGGTGLGLAIVYRIVQEHDGRIRVRSRRGVGTEIVISLPRRGAGRAEGEGAWIAS
ncbi:MAG TPA: ATP-binding protein [Candidatus Polarisedimenticolia bacterium]|nr:ATP-binding protein [Candidatus Polarisedimenticolia bacterium]